MMYIDDIESQRDEMELTLDYYFLNGDLDNANGKQTGNDDTTLLSTVHNDSDDVNKAIDICSAEKYTMEYSRSFSYISHRSVERLEHAPCTYSNPN